MTTKALERQVGRVFSPRAHCGLNATGVDPDSFDVAMGARLAVNEDFELSAGWISNLHLPQSSSARRGRLGLPIM
jgi:hypothetical protein